MLYSPALAHPFEGHGAHFHAVDIADVAPRVHFYGRALIEPKSQLQYGPPRGVSGKTVEMGGGPPGTSGASLVYAGYPYDPYA
jgi:hypothetical protein